MGQVIAAVPTVSSFRRNAHLMWLAVPLLCLAGVTSAAALLPGVYMDAVNPDYLVVNALASGAYRTPALVMPGNLIAGQWPIMPMVYHGALPFWVGLPLYALLGTDVAGIRLTNAAFAASVILAMWWMLSAMGVRAWLIAAMASAMVLDPAFAFIFRTQFYLTTLPAALLFASVALAWPVLRGTAQRPGRRLAVSGFAAGLAAYGYFIFAFYGAVLAALVIWAARRSSVKWIAGLALGLVPVAAGWLLLTAATGDLAAVLRQSQALGTFADQSSLSARLGETVNLMFLALNGRGVNAMMFGEPVAFAAIEVKWIALLIVPGLGWLGLQALRRPQPALGLVAALALLPPLAYGMLFGSRLWVQHFTVLVPVVYAFAALSYNALLNAAPSIRLKSVVPPIIASMAIVNAFGFAAVVDRLEATGGRGSFSSAINDFASQSRGDTALYVFPDWGLFMPFVMITHGQVQVRLAFDADVVARTVCQGRDVVLASSALDAQVLLRTRAALVPQPVASTAVFSDRTGSPVVYSARWLTSDAQYC